MTRDLKDELAVNGFAIVENAVADSPVQTVAEALSRMFATSDSDKPYRLRGVTNIVAEVAELAESRAIRELVEPVLGIGAFIVQSLFFDKTAEANWNVAWHQDLMIPVQDKVDEPQYGPWSLKEGVWHVQPPVRVLEGMLIVRLHLDECRESNGPLRVLSGSHRARILTGEQIDALRAEMPEVTCAIGRGGALLMRPLLLHASSRAKSPQHRRVIHLEFAAEALPGDVRWLRTRK